MIARWVPCVVYSSLILLSSLLSVSRVLREWNIKEEEIWGRTKEINQPLNTLHLQKVHSGNRHSKLYQESFIIKIWKINLNPLNPITFIYPCIYQSMILMALIELKILKMRANVAMETFTCLDCRTLSLNLQT